MGKLDERIIPYLLTRPGVRNLRDVSDVTGDEFLLKGELNVGGDANIEISILIKKKEEAEIVSAIEMQDRLNLG